MAAIQINRTVDLSRMVQPEALTGVTFTEESGGHEFVLTAKDEVLSGTIKARFMRGDGSTTEFFGNTVDGVAHLTLTADCYEVAGRFLMTVFYDGGDGMAVIYAAVGHVVKSSNGAVTPSQPAAQSFEDILAGYVQRMTSATNAANTAADAASEAATDAEAAAASSVRYDVSQSLTETQQEQARENIGVVDKGLSDAAKTALLDCFAHVVWIDEHGQAYYNALRSALYAESYPRLTAVFNPGLHVVYTDDDLSTLKPYLTVTYYETVDSAGVVVAANDYTLSGVLVDGQSSITVLYSNMLTAFNVVAVDFYNQYHWSTEAGNLTVYRASVSEESRTEAANILYNSGGSNVNVRRCVGTDRGLGSPYWDVVNSRYSDYYPIPVPDDATRVTITVTPAAQYLAAYTFYKADDKYMVINASDIGWKQGTYSYNLDTTHSGRVLAIAGRFNSSNGTYTTEPEFTVDFE